MLEVVVAGDHPTIIVDRETKNSGVATVRQQAEGAAANKAAGQHMQQDSAIRRRPAAERTILRRRGSWASESTSQSNAPAVGS